MLHEIGHMLMHQFDGSQCDPSDDKRLTDDRLSRLVRHLGPGAVSRVLARDHCSTVEEQEAEMITSLILERVDRDRPGSFGEGIAGRLGQALVLLGRRVINPEDLMRTMVFTVSWIVLILRTPAAIRSAHQRWIWLTVTAQSVVTLIDLRPVARFIDTATGIPHIADLSKHLAALVFLAATNHVGCPGHLLGALPDLLRDGHHAGRCPHFGATSNRYAVASYAPE
ncbi:MAG TPA: hypothetical protein VF003_16180 [Pseudonocardiaceae bacterium]